MSLPSPESLLQHAAWVRRVARCVVAGDDLVDDVVQETWLSVLGRPPRHELNVRGWLAQVTRNVARKLGRNRAARLRHERANAAAVHEAQTADVILERVALQRQVVDAVLALDEPYRLTILLRYFENVAAVEIAARQGIPVETVRTRIKRGLALLRESLDRTLGGADRSRLALIALLHPPASTGPVLSATIAGALVMSAKVKLATVLVVLLGVGAGVLAVATSGRRSPADAGAPPAARVDADSPTHATDDRLVRAEQLPARPGEPASASAPTGGIVHGTVRSANGEVVPGAIVIAGDVRVNATFAAWRGFADALILRAARDGHGEGSGWRLVQSDAIGCYELASLRPGPRWTITAWQSRNGAAAVFGVVLDENTPTTLDITLRDSVMFCGRVTDLRGAPIGRARVVVSRVVVANGITSYPPPTAAETDELGQYACHPLDRGTFELHAGADGCAWQKTPRVEPPPGQLEYRQDFVLEPASSPPIQTAKRATSDEPGTLIVHAHDTHNAPLAQFAVTLVPIFSTRTMHEARQVRQAAGLSGTAELPAIPPNNYQLTVRGDGYQSFFERVHVPAGPGCTEVQAIMERASCSVRGVVRDETGTAVKDADVVLLKPSGKPAAAHPDYVTRTDSEGRFEFTGIAAGSYTLVANPLDADPILPKVPTNTLASACVSVNVSERTPDVPIVLSTGVVISIQPVGRDQDFFQDYAVRILDARGVPLFDGLRLATRSAAVATPARATWFPQACSRPRFTVPDGTLVARPSGPPPMRRSRWSWCKNDRVGAFPPNTTP